MFIHVYVKLCFALGCYASAQDMHMDDTRITLSHRSGEIDRIHIDFIQIVILHMLLPAHNPIRYPHRA